MLIAARVSGLCLLGSLAVTACPAEEEDTPAMGCDPSASSTASATGSMPPAMMPPAGTLKVCERPESARFDAGSNSWYVSCQIKPDMPGDGYVTQVDGAGTMVVTEKFVSGLNEPKGIAINGEKLYVSDVTGLVTANLSDGTTLATTPVAGIDPEVPEMPFLNDVVVNPATGNVYVSDNRNGALFRFDADGGTPTLLVKDAALEAPNGLVLDMRDPANPGLLVAGMGPGLDPMRGVTAKLGCVMSVTLADLDDGDKKVTLTVVSPRVGNLDGIEFDGADLVISDFFAGRVMKLSPSMGEPMFNQGDAKILKQTLLRAADLGIDPVTRRAAVPETNNGTLVFLDLATL
jgi:outer membrane protein assembly factor BamB